MTNILDKIVANKRIEVAKEKEITSLKQLADQIIDTTNTYSFKDALIDSSTGIIAEFKRKSPSKGWIFESAQVEDIIPLYSEGGASAISILTDYDFFGGDLFDLASARTLTTTPLLRKEFVIDEYQLYQAKIVGANAILLIASCLSVDETKQLAQKAKELGLDILLEIHNETELGHINEFVDVVGVNNRNLNTFVTDVQVSFDLIDKIPSQLVRISESGISDTQTVKDLQQVGYKGFLMGENFMKTDNPGQTLAQFIKDLA